MKRFMDLFAKTKIWRAKVVTFIAWCVLLAAFWIIVITLMIGFASAVDENGMCSAEAAGWMQPIGSFLAICGAIWIAHKQNMDAVQRDTAKERREVENFISATRDEIEFLKKRFNDTIGEELKNLGPLQSVFPILVNETPIYSGNANLISKIPDAIQRKCMIAAYSSASGLMASIAKNNEVLDKWENAGKNTQERRGFRRQMRELSDDVIRPSFAEVSEQFDKFLAYKR